MSLVVNDLRVGTMAGDVIVDGVSFSVARGRVMGLVGESGSGKSTLALALLGFSRPGARIDGGEVLVDGVNLLDLPAEGKRRARGRTVAYIPQDPATALNPALSLREQLLETLPRGPEALQQVREILKAVGLPADERFLKRMPAELSGGQQQRIAIAMAIAPHPSVLVLDEPTTGLDVSTQAMVLELIAQLCRDRNMAAVYISHDLAVVAQVADDVTVLYGGMVVESGLTLSVLTDASHPYTRALLRAVPSVAERSRLRPIRGIAPGVDNCPAGCVFSDRCDFATDDCRREVPPLMLMTSGTEVRCIRTDAVRREPLVTEPLIAHRPVRDSSANALEAREVNVRYGQTQVVFDVDFDVPRGSCLAVVGESGSGKTTLSRCLVGLHRQFTGTLRLDGSVLTNAAGRRSRDQRRKVQYVFQNPYASLHPRRTVRDSLWLAARMFGTRSSDADRVVEEAVTRMEIPVRLLDRFPSDLSGGQRQRIAIARALLADPEVLICDEVTSALDVSVQASIVELLRSLLADGLSLLFVTHNLAVVRSLADDVIVLRGGRVVERGTVDKVLDTPQDEYTRRLLADVVDLPPLDAGGPDERTAREVTHGA